jgi:hypothetical protein
MLITANCTCSTMYFCIQGGVFFYSRGRNITQYSECESKSRGRISFSPAQEIEREDIKKKKNVN